MFLRQCFNDSAFAHTGWTNHNERLHQIINLILIKNTMSKPISQGYKLSSMVFNFLKGKVSSELTLPHIEQNFKSHTADKANCLNIYRMISEDQQRKLTPIVRVIDGQLLSHIKTEELSNFVTIYVYRLKALIWYNLPFEECLKQLNEQVLLRTELSRTEMQALLSVLTVSPVNISSNFNKFISTIFDVLQQHLTLNKSNMQLAYLFAISKIIIRSQYRVPQTIQNHLNQLLDQHFASIDYQQLSSLSHEVRSKSISHLQKLGLMQLSPLRKQVIYQLLMAKCNGGLQLNEQLPGRSWQYADELQVAISAIKSLCVKEPYVEIFALERGVEHELEVESVCYLKKPQFIAFYIEHIFFFVKNGYLPIDEYSVCRILRTFRSFFSKEGQLNSEFFQQFQQSTPVDLLKFLIILHQFKRYDLEVPHFQQTIHSMLNLALKYVNRSYIKTFKFETWKPLEMSLLYSFLHHQSLDILTCAQSQKPLQPWLLSWELIGDILAVQKEKKSVNSEYSRVEVFHRFVNATIKREKNKKGDIKDILSSKIVNKEEMKQLLEIQGEQDESLLAKRVSHFMEKFTLLKGVTLLPNKEISYLVVEKGSSKIRAVVDCQGLKIDDLTYPGAEQLVFTLKGTTKIDFLIYYYNCTYHYTRTPSELTQLLLSLLP